MTRDERIDRLVALGRISSEEAAQLRKATVDLETKARSLSPERPAPQAVHLRFFAGDIDAEELRRTCRRRCVHAGLLFGLIFGPLTSLAAFLGLGFLLPATRVSAAGIPELIASSLKLGALAGLSAGGLFALFFFVVLFASRIPAWIRFAELVEGGLDPVPEPRLGQCPLCGAEDADTQTWRRPTNLHWILNPGLAFNELALGQRVPAEVHVCRQCKVAFLDCPSCERSFGPDIDMAGNWRERLARGFGNWRGYPCERCGEPLPSLRNALAALILLPLRLFGLIGGEPRKGASGTASGS